MTKTIDEGIVVFHNTHDAIKADNICDTPWNNFSSLIETLEKEDVRYKALYYSRKIGIKREVELLYEDNSVIEINR